MNIVKGRERKKIQIIKSQGLSWDIINIIAIIYWMLAVYWHSFKCFNI